MRSLAALITGMAAGALGHYVATPDAGLGRAGLSRQGEEREGAARQIVVEDRRVAALEAENERLRALLAARDAPETAEPCAGDTPGDVERLIEEAYVEREVDWLLEAVRRLLRMGEPGYPLLRRLIGDLRGARFVPNTSDYRMDHIYALGRIVLEEEARVIAFLDYLLTDPGTEPSLRQMAMMGAAFYVGSHAPGTERLQRSLASTVLDQGTGGAAGGSRMQILAMAMSRDPAMGPALREQLGRTEDPELQARILGAMAYLGDESAVSLIEKRLDPESGNFTREVSSLGRVGTEEAHGVAMRFLETVREDWRFYPHARCYLRSGGGDRALRLVEARIRQNPDDAEVARTIPTLRRLPTQASLATLRLIAETSGDAEVRGEATAAAVDVERRLRGEPSKVAR